MLCSVEDLMPIGEFSERSGLSPKRLRSYAADGLLVPAAVDAASGYRYYAPGQLREARLIDALRQAGMPLADIGTFLRDPSGEHLDAWVRHVERDAAHRQEALDLARRVLATGATAWTSVHGERPRKGSTKALRSASRTDIGRVRDSHEDAVVGDERLALVTDGIGGHSGGEVASAIAAAVVQAAFTGRSIDELEAAARAANRAIWERSHGSSDLEGMGTTLCAAGLTDDGELTVVHVGDSRLYLLREGSLRQLTVDHSWTGELVRSGELSEQEARGHPHRGVLTRALGVRPDVELDSAAYPALEGDRLLLCSDGLFNEVLDHEIGSVMAGAPDVRAASDELLELALARGGHDNISVVVAEVCVESDSRRPPRP